MVLMIRLGHVPLRRWGLGQATAQEITVRVQDQDGRPVPGIDVEVTIENGRPQQTWKYNVGLDGATSFRIPDAAPGSVLLVGPALPLDFASTPPFERIMADGQPHELVFSIAARRPERDILAPLVIFTLTGILSATAMYFILGTRKK